MNFMSEKAGRGTETMSEVWENRGRTKDGNHTTEEAPITFSVVFP